MFTFFIAEITSAFMSFIRHYDVLAEPDLRLAVHSASLLTRKAPQQILNSKLVEDVLSDGRGWNRAAWTVWGGSYAGPDRGGMEKEVYDWGTSEGSNPGEVNDDGGWLVEPGQRMPR